MLMCDGHCAYHNVQRDSKYTQINWTARSLTLQNAWHSFYRALSTGEAWLTMLLGFFKNVMVYPSISIHQSQCVMSSGDDVVWHKLNPLWTHSGPYQLYRPRLCCTQFTYTYVGTHMKTFAPSRCEIQYLSLLLCIKWPPLDWETE